MFIRRQRRHIITVPTSPSSKEDFWGPSMVWSGEAESGDSTEDEGDELSFELVLETNQINAKSFLYCTRSMRNSKMSRHKKRIPYNTAATIEWFLSRAIKRRSCCIVTSVAEGDVLIE
jgi:hypothetical protein